AYRADEELISNYVLTVIESPDATKTALELQGDDAQGFLDVLQNAERSSARRIIQKLSEACGKLPSSLPITGVTDCDKHPVHGGGYADVYRASY
ncbi:hypothetical protein DFH07DRAFT_714395, partial [Mycena maculata]